MAKDFEDFDDVIAAVSWDKAIDILNLTMKKQGNQWRGCCPVHGPQSPRSLVITEGRGFYCNGERKGGQTVIGLASHIKDLSPQDAARLLAGRPEPEKKKPAEGQTTNGRKSSEGFRPLEYLVSDHDAVVALGFRPDDAARIGAGYAPRGVLSGTVAIPVRDASGKLLGYVGVLDAKLPASWHF